MNALPIPGQRPENIAELVKTYIYSSGVITQSSLPMGIIRVPYAPTYNTEFILKRFWSHSDFIDEVAATEHARTAFDSWMPGSHIVPDTYWKCGLYTVVAMEHIPGQNGSEVDMGFWTRWQRRDFVRQMAVIGICLIWGARDTTSQATTKDMIRGGLKDKSSAAYDLGNALRGVVAPWGPSLQNFRFLRPCDVSLRGSKIVAIISWKGTVDRRERKVGQGPGCLSALTVLGRAAPQTCGTLGDPDWAIIREYGGGIGEDDFLKEQVDNVSDEYEGGREDGELAEGWYHEPVWQLVSECVCRR